MPDAVPIRFPYEPERARNAALWLVLQHGGRINKLKLVKLAFIADREHLFRYGRPIIGGDYFAMPHGPVASQFLKDLNSSAPDLPFRLSSSDRYAVEANGVLNEDYLAESDLEVLRDINARYGDRDGYALRDMLHETRAYQKTWIKGGSKQSFPMSYQDFFLDAPDDRKPMLDAVLDAQEAWNILR